MHNRYLPAKPHPPIGLEPRAPRVVPHSISVTPNAPSMRDLSLPIFVWCTIQNPCTLLQTSVARAADGCPVIDHPEVMLGVLIELHA